MVIKKWVRTEQEVGVEVTAEDIREELEASKPDSGSSPDEVVATINSAGMVLKAVTLEMIEALKPAPRSVIANFLFTQSLRYGVSDELKRARILEEETGAKWCDDIGWLMPFYNAAGESQMFPVALWIERRKEAARDTAELKAWKESALAVEASWNPQELANLIGLKPGDPIRQGIEAYIRKTVAKEQPK
jgi:hypothetical protein